MGSKVEVWSAGVRFLVWVAHLLPYMGIAFLLGMIIVCVVSFRRDWMTDRTKFEGYVTWTAIFGFVYFAFMVYLWWLSLPDTPLPR